MRLTRSLFAFFVLLIAGTAAFSQAPSEAGPIRSSPAYSEVLLRKTQLQADLEALIADYTEAHPKILDLRAELAAINKSIERIFAVKPAETGKLTLALGKLLVEQATLQTDFVRLQRTYNQEHIEVKRAKRKLEIFESAINEILK
jgi:Skp family chaperone for outer membrane proteins